jgi:hypothetical protein
VDNQGISPQHIAKFCIDEEIYMCKVGLIEGSKEWGREEALL